MRTALKTIFQDFTGLLFPAFCYGCERSLSKGEVLICTNCRIKLPYARLHLVPPNENPLFHRFSGRIPVRHVYAYLYFKRLGRVQKLLHALKYRGKEEIGEMLGQWFGQELYKSGLSAEIDLILPVPLHAGRQRQRGYNQSESFARGLSATLQVPENHQVLLRHKQTTTQTHKTRVERWQNVEHVFQVSKPEKIRDQRLLLVDDVLTTGATLEACAQTLLRAGCASVSVATIAAA